MNNLQDIKIEVTNSEDKKLALTLAWDCTLDEWVRAFKLILKWISWQEEQIKEVFKNEEE